MYINQLSGIDRFYFINPFLLSVINILYTEIHISIIFIL